MAPSTQRAPATAHLNEARDLRFVYEIAPLRALNVIDTDPEALEDLSGEMLSGIMRSIQAQDMPGALLIAQTHLRDHPRNPAVANLVAALALQQKNGVLAKKTLDIALRFAPNDHKVINNQACLLIQTHQYLRAQNILMAGNKKSSATFAEYYYNLARAEFELRNGMQALTHLETADRMGLLPDSVALRARIAIQSDDLGQSYKILKDGLLRFPGSALLHNNSAVVAMLESHHDDAILHAVQAINLEPGNPFHGSLFGIANKSMSFAQPRPDLVQAMASALQLPGVNTGHLGQNWQTMVHEFPGWKSILRIVPPARQDEIPAFLATIKQDNPLCWQMVTQGLRRIVIRQETFELALGSLRSWYLSHIAQGGSLDDQDRDLLTGLAIQNHFNEYVYYTSPEDQALIDRLHAELDPQSPHEDTILALICFYKITHYLTVSQAKKWLNHPIFHQIICLQVLDPEREFALMQSLPKLTPIQDNISLQVEQMYMDNPYPAWVSTNYAGAQDYLRLSPKVKDRVQMLVAGCGTGQHALYVALSYRNVHVTAIDLSRRSLAYAQRKTEELGLSHITYAQADILELGSLGQQFDAIECAGVLHHMHDPEKGLGVLVNLLKPGGTMMIGLYSEIAREGIVKARQEIASRGLTGSAEEIRAFRHELLLNPDSELARGVLWRGDFYTVSTCRDLIFHVQEHRFTIPQLKDMLARHNLTFTYFNNKPYWDDAFSKKYPGRANFADLDLWHEFEQENPQVFAGMYQFMVRKPIQA